MKNMPRILNFPISEIYDVMSWEINLFFYFALPNGGGTEEKCLLKIRICPIKK